MIGQLWPAAPASGDRWRPQLPLQEQVAVIFTVLLVLAAILTFGADRNDFALLFSGLLALEIGLLVLTQEWARSALIKRFAFLAVSNTFAALRLFPMGSREKDTEILAPRHQVRVLQRQLGSERVRF